MLNYYKYQVPFVKPFRTSLGEFKQREGVILEFDDGKITAYGEVSPLPGFSTETLEQVIVVLEHNKEVLSRAFTEGDADQMISVIDAIHRFPSLSFGLDTLNLDLQAKRNNTSLSELLFQKPYQPVRCNTSVGMGDESELFSDISKAINNGFDTIKVKVGKDIDTEVALVEKIRKSFPAVKIRLDANQAWNEKKATKYLHSFSEFSIEYCEQPVPATDITALKAVTDRSDIPVAADESARTLSDVTNLLDIAACDLFIIKPSLFGRIGQIIVTIDLLNTHNNEAIFTTALDGIIGRTMTAILASGLGSGIHAHGLATGSHLIEQGSRQEIENGYYVLSDEPGLSAGADKTNLTLLP